MTTEPTAPTIEAWVSLMRATRGLLADVEEDLKSAGYPPLEWYDVLLELDRAPDGWLRQSEVTNRVLLAQYSLSRLADRLQREGLIERRQCPLDGRNNVLVITAKGRDLRRAMWQPYAQAIQDRLGRYVSDPDAAMLASILARIVNSKPPQALDKSPHEG